MIIFGVDPGTARVGWGVVRSNGREVHALAYGCITTTPSDLPPDRLKVIHKECTKLFKRFHPDALSLEALFFSANAKTAIPVGQARGVILLAASENHVPVVSYSPPAIKRTITGNGRADKTQVQRMVKLLLKLKEIPKPDDTADALAIAMTHAFTKNFSTHSL